MFWETTTLCGKEMEEEEEMEDEEEMEEEDEMEEGEEEEKERERELRYQPPDPTACYMCVHCYSCSISSLLAPSFHPRP